MNIRFIGFDSMGTRGMATVVEIEGLKIFIDPGVSIAPRRYGLPPHPIELSMLENALNHIHEEVVDSDILVISHYHRDHYLYREDEVDFYRDKILLIKDPSSFINYSQRVRAYVLLEKHGVKNIVKTLGIGDSRTYSFEGVRISFSKPVPHGPSDTSLGYVLMTLIEYEDYRILHASDVQGPIDHETTMVIKNFNPNILIISGPPTYFEGFKMDKKHVEAGLRNLESLVAFLPSGSRVIVDHHILRDLDYRNRLVKVYEKALENNVEVLTAAEYMGLEVNQLEALRRELWRRERNR